MRRANHLRRRGAFTLVELLIVITILGIMFALTAAAVVRALGKGDEVKVRSELSQLAMAVKAFQQDYQVSYMPDRLVLPPATDPASVQFITSLWPRINTSRLSNGAYWQSGSSQPTVLSGHQTLVFFLGGYRDGGIPVGFSTDPTDPMKQTGNRKQPHYEFPSDRLRSIPEGSNFPYPSFIDVYGRAPYIYYSSAGSGNDYRMPLNYPTNWQQQTNNPTYVVTYRDEGSTTAQPFWVAPFLTRFGPGVTTRFANPSGFQIICAGRDTRFGVGGPTWAGGPTGIGNNKDGIDDMANFHATQLGIAGN